MLSYAYQVLMQKNYEEMETEEFDNVYDLLAAILSKGISMQLKRGLNREYIEKNDQLSVLRGKINITDSIRLRINNKQLLSCDYDHFSEDNLMNKILKTTVLILINSEDVKKSLRLELKRTLLFFSDINTIEPSSINWSTIRFNSNNATYRLLINICYLILQGLLITTESGKLKLASFLDDQKMSRLYEKFILEYYIYHHNQYRPASRQISWDTEGDISFLPVMKTDIMLINGPNRLIIDAKYYSKTMQKHYETYKIHSSNLYQIFSYVKNEDKYNTGKVKGVLLYAKTDEALVPNYKYNLGGNQIAVKTLDLNVPFNIIRMQLDGIIEDW